MKRGYVHIYIIYAHSPFPFSTTAFSYLLSLFPFIKICREVIQFFQTTQLSPSANYFSYSMLIKEEFTENFHLRAISFQFDESGGDKCLLFFVSRHCKELHIFWLVSWF